MSHEPLRDRIARMAADEADSILGELARLMPSGLRARAEDTAQTLTQLGLPLPAPIAWVLDLDVITVHVPPPVAPPEPPAPTPSPTAAATIAAAADAERLERGDDPADTRPKITVDLDDPADDAESTRAAAPAAPPAEPPAPPRARVALREPPAKPAAKPAPAKPAPSGETYTTASGVTRHKPTNVGIEGVPEHLRTMPAAAGRGPLKPRVETAELQLRILEEVNKHRNVVSKEVADALGIQLNRSTNHLKALAEAGLIRFTGKNRLAKTAKTGKPGYEYAPARAGDAPTSAPVPAVKPPARDADNLARLRQERDDAVVSALREGPLRWKGLENRTGFHPNKLKQALTSLGDRVVKQPDGFYAIGSTPDPQPADAPPSAAAVDAPAPDAAPASSVELDLKGAQLLAKHSQFAATMAGKGPFPPSAAAEAIGVPAEVSQAMLSLLTEQTRGAVVNDVGVPGAPLFEYNEIKGPGAAAQRDHERSRERSRAEAHGPANGSVRGAPVAGTGWDASSYSSNKEVQRRLRMAHGKGWPISKRGSGHIMVETPSGPVTIGSTPNSAGLREDGKHLEEHGLRGAIAR